MGKLVFFGFVYESVSVNREFLLKKVDNDHTQLKSIISNVTKMVDDSIEGLRTNILNDKNKQWLINQLALISIDGVIPKEFKGTLRDILIDDKFDMLKKLNSSSRVSDLVNIINSYKSSKMSHSRKNLTKDEQCIWLRVKVFHEFGDGFKWVNAVDSEGNLAGYIPSEITNKTMNHCGNEPTVSEGDVYYGLRDHNNKEYLSVIVDKNGNIKESKGRYNKKPVEDVKKYMKWLMMNDSISGANYGNSHAKHMNYSVSQMLDDNEFITQVKTQKPLLIDNYEELVMELKEKLNRNEISEQLIIDKFIKRRSYESFTFDQLISVLDYNPFSEEQLIELIEEDAILCEEIADAESSLLTTKIQKCFIDRVANRKEHDSGYDLDHDTTTSTLLYLMAEQPNNRIDGYYLFSNLGDSISLEKYDRDLLSGFMKNSKSSLDMIVQNATLVDYILRSISLMREGHKAFISAYEDILIQHVNNDLKKPPYYLAKSFQKALNKSGFKFAKQLLNKMDPSRKNTFEYILQTNQH